MSTPVTDLDRRRARRCRTCNGFVWSEAAGRLVRQRATTNLVCQACGWDYARDGQP